VAGTEFQVTASVPPAMTVSVGAGMAFVQGASSATQGVYTVVNDSSFTLAVSAANPSNPRIDLVVLEVLDQAYSGSSNLAQVRVLAGTPATNPAPPTATGSFIALAQIQVPANASAVTSANITDLRPFSTALGAPIPVRSLVERNAIPNKWDGLRVFMMDNAWEVHTYAGGEWFGETPRYYGVTSFTYPANITDYTARTIVDRAKIPDPGFRYMLRLDADLEFLGARVNGQVYCESTTTTSYANLVATGQTLDWEVINTGQFADDNVRLYINRVFPGTYTGNRWVTFRAVKEASEASATFWSAHNYFPSFQITMHPIRPNGFVTATSVGGQP
jgi:hypothetical protein